MTAADRARLRELIARFQWFVETGDMRQWSGPGATIDMLRDAVREDVRALLSALDARDEAIRVAREALRDKNRHHEDDPSGCPACAALRSIDALIGREP